jgi:hypothetical protein
MNTRKRLINLSAVAVVVIGILGMTIETTHADVLYSDDFSGINTDLLHGTTPDITTGGATWVATSNYKADGSSTGLDASTMTLAFAPVNGNVYTLDAQIGTVGGIQWVQFGFGGSQVTNVVWTTRPWMLLRQAGGESSNHAASPGSGAGTGGLVNWTSLSTLTYAAGMNVRIVLDTTGGDGLWTATWFAKATADGTYTEVRAATTLDATQDDITSFGFSTFNSGNNTVQFNSISLSTPPPAGTVFIIQ